MRHVGLTILAAAAAVLLGVLPQTDLAARGSGPPPCDGVRQADATFEGTVTSVEARARADVDENGRSRWYDERLVRFRDVRRWRGERTETVVSPTGGGTNADGTMWIMPDAAGYEFDVGSRYLVVASRRQAGGPLIAHGNSLTRPSEEAATLLAYVESLSKPPAGGRVWGRVAATFLEPEPARLPTDLIHVSLEGPVGREVVVNGDDRFEFDGLPPGEYRFRARTYVERRELVPPVDLPVKLTGDYACAELDVFFSPSH